MSGIQTLATTTVKDSYRTAHREATKKAYALSMRPSIRFSARSSSFSSVICFCQISAQQRQELSIEPSKARTQGPLNEQAQCVVSRLGPTRRGTRMIAQVSVRICKVFIKRAQDHGRNQGFRRGGESSFSHGCDQNVRRLRVLRFARQKECRRSCPDQRSLPEPPPESPVVAGW